MLEPVAGSAQLSDRDRATGWEDDDDGGRQFIGYLVDLDDGSDR
jgi:hypothetical protein